MPSRPAGRPSIATKTTVWPSRAQCFGPFGERAGVDAELARAALRLPSATARPSTRPLTPLPVSDWNASAGVSLRARARRAAAAIAAARGCSLPLEAGGQAEQLGLVLAGGGHDR